MSRRGWVAPCAIGSALVLAQVALGVAEADRRAAGLGIAAGLFLAAAGSASGADPLRVPVLRELSVLLGAGAASAAGWALDASPALVTAILSGAAIAGTGVWIVAAA